MGISHDVQRVFADMHVDYPTHRVLVTNSLTAAKETMLHSDAFAVFSDLIVRHEVENGTVRAVGFEQIKTDFWYQLVAREDYIVTELMMDLISALIRVCRDMSLELHPAATRIRAGRRLVSGALRLGSEFNCEPPH